MIAKYVIYHIGYASFKAEPPKSVVKYVNKLTVSGGKIVAIGVTIKRAISKVLMHLAGFSVQYL